MLDYIFAIRSPILPVGTWLLSLFIGLVLGYFLMFGRKTLYRIPYLFLFGTLYFLYMLLSWLVTYLAITTNMILLPPLVILALLSLPSFLLGFFYMVLAVMRARDGFGSKRAAWLSIVPLLNLGLFIVTLDDDKNDPEPPIARDPIWTAKFMNGAVGIVLGTIIAFLAFCIGMQILTLPAMAVRATLGY